jgi:hypothetical protein
MRKNPVRQDVGGFGKDMGLVHEAVVTGRKVGAGTDFWAALAHDEGLFRRVVGIVLPCLIGMTEAELMASSILGSGKMIGYRDATRAWNANLLETEPDLPFSEATLTQCAEENKKGADWRVVWVNGLSLRKQREFQGFNRRKQPCFDPDYTWWMDNAQDPWANQTVEAGYRLLDFSARYRNMTWAAQSDEIAILGEDYERAEEQAVAEATFTIYLASGAKKERVLRNWYHWGRLRTDGGPRVSVGHFDEDGFRVDGYWNADPYGGLAVVLSRK